VTTGNYKESQNKLFKFRFFCSIKNINTGIDFNFRAGIKYFLPVNYKIESSAETAKELVTPDVNLYINNLPEYGFGNQINYAASGVQNKRCFDEYF
jgi:hypothetical protein